MIHDVPFLPREFTFNLRLFNRCTFLKRSSCGAEAMVRNASHDEEIRFFFFGFSNGFIERTCSGSSTRKLEHTGILDAILHESSKINQTPSIGNCTEFTFDFLQ